MEDSFIFEWIRFLEESEKSNYKSLYLLKNLWIISLDKLSQYYPQTIEERNPNDLHQYL